MRRDWLVALLVPVALYVLLADGWFSRVDAAMLMTGYSIRFFFLPATYSFVARIAISRYQSQNSSRQSRRSCWPRCPGGILQSLW